MKYLIKYTEDGAIVTIDRRPLEEDFDHSDAERDNE